MVIAFFSTSHHENAWCMSFGLDNVVAFPSGLPTSRHNGHGSEYAERALDVGKGHCIPKRKSNGECG
jgi:hypothetical protein